jgi:hypothetical protein
MPDLSAPAAAIAASGIAYPAAMAVGIPDALALPVAVAAAGGASWAMSNRERVDQYTLGAVVRALVAWVFSWLFGVIFGPAAASLAMYFLPVGAAQVVLSGGLAVGFALVLSAVAISHALPLVLRQLDRRADRLGGGDGQL